MRRRRAYHTASGTASPVTTQRWSRRVREKPDETAVTHVIDAASGEIIDEFPGVYGLRPTDDPNVVIAVFGEDGTVGHVRRRPTTCRSDTRRPGFRDADAAVVTRRSVSSRAGRERYEFTVQGVDLDAGAASTAADRAGRKVGGRQPAPCRHLRDDAVHDRRWHSEFRIDTSRRHHRCRARRGQPSAIENIASEGATLIVST